MNTETHEKLNTIKQSFRLSMNGTISHSMRTKGFNYKINWGIPLHELKVMAQYYGKDPILAAELWKEDIRECKILATYIMPPEIMTPEITRNWMQQTSTQEIAELLAFNLFRYLPFANKIAHEFIASPQTITQICGYQILSSLFADGQTPSPQNIDSFLNQAKVTMEDTEIKTKHAAYNCILRFCGLGESYTKAARKNLSHLDIFDD